MSGRIVFGHADRLITELAVVEGFEQMAGRKWLLKGDELWVTVRVV